MELMDEVGRATSLEQIYVSALTYLREALDVHRASVLLFDDEGVMRFVAWRGLSDGYRAAVDGHSPWTPDEKSPATILVPDVRTDASLTELQGVFEREGIGALAFIPLRFGGRLLGKFMLYYGEPHSFEDQEVAAAELAARHVSFALEHRRIKRDLEDRLETERELRQRAERENELRTRLERHKELLIQAGQALSRSLDRDETFATLAELVVPRFADWYAVHLVDDDGVIAPAHLAHADPDRRQLALRAVERWPTRSDAATGAPRAIRTGESQLIEDISPELLAQTAQDAEHLEIIEQLGLRSAMVVPLKPAGETIGALTFVAAESGRHYGPPELAVAEALANRVALALDNARLYHEADEARRSAEQAASRLEILSRASAAIAPALDPDDALVHLARFIASNLADYCVAYRLQDDGVIRRVGIAHADGERQRLVEELVRAGPPTLEDTHGVGAVLRTGEPVLAVEVPAELLETAAQNRAHLEVLRQLEPISSVIVALEARGRTLGAVALATTTRSGRRYGEADLALAEEIATRAALLIDNARLYAEARRATRARDEMLAVVSHDLRGPLNSIVTASRLLEVPLPEERRTRSLASVRRAAEQMTRLLGDLLDVTRIEAGRLSVHIEPVEVGELVNEIVSMHGPLAEDRSIRLVGDGPGNFVEIGADRGRLGQALTNLVGNALKFTPEGGEVRVTVRADPATVRIAVLDTGPGIPVDQLPHLFDRFWRGSRDGRGIGLGLTIAKGIAEAHRGGIQVESRPGEGAQFTLVLPVTASVGSSP